MIKACLHIASDKQGTKNYPFLAGPEGDGFKNMLYSFVLLKKVLAERGIDLATKDINTPEESKLLFCWDNPHLLVKEKKENQIWCLLINDPPIYVPQSWDPAYHVKFDYVFTFDETLVDGKKYFYYPFAIDTEYFSHPEKVSEEDFNKRKLATFVSHAIHKLKDPQNPGSTLHLRYNTLKWFADNYPDDFRFYGGTFLKRDYFWGFRGVSLVKRILPSSIFKRIARYAQRNLFKVFGGELKPLEKFDIIKQFRFYYCYENTIGINGYVCEKIFDCFYSGVVPVYWGAPNIHELIPYNCFIDGTKFKSEEELFHFLKNITYQEYCAYLDETERFLKSKEMERFTVRNSVEKILEPISFKKIV